MLVKLNLLILMKMLLLCKFIDGRQSITQEQFEIVSGLLSTDRRWTGNYLQKFASDFLIWHLCSEHQGASSLLSAKNTLITVSYSFSTIIKSYKTLLVIILKDYYANLLVNPLKNSFLCKLPLIYLQSSYFFNNCQRNL